MRLTSPNFTILFKQICPPSTINDIVDITSKNVNWRVKSFSHHFYLLTFT